MSIANASPNKPNQPSPIVIWDGLKLIAFLVTVAVAALASLGVLGWIALALVGF